MTQTKKSAAILIACLGLAILTSCQSVDILSNVNEKKDTHLFSAAADSLWLVTYIKQPGSDSLEKLMAYNAGFVKVVNHPAYLEKWRTLSPARMQQLRDNVIQMANSIPPSSKGVEISPNGCYEIYYQDVVREEINAGTDAKHVLLQLVDDAIKEIVHDELSITLTVTPAIQNGIKGYLLNLEMITSASTRLFLAFPPNQGVEFLVYPENRDAFTQPVRHFSLLPPIAEAQNNGLLRPHQPITFSAFWDGTDEQGRAVRGSVAILGKLFSVPGGTPLARTIQLD